MSEDVDVCYLSNAVVAKFRSRRIKMFWGKNRILKFLEIFVPGGPWPPGRLPDHFIFLRIGPCIDPDAHCASAVTPKNFGK